MTFDVFRLMRGERAGNVDYLGQIEAESLSSAEDYAQLMFDCAHGEEELEVTEADDDELQPDTCVECGELAVGFDDGSPLCAKCYRSKPAFFDPKPTPKESGQ